MTREVMLEYVHRFYPNWMPLNERQLQAFYFKLKRTDGPPPKKARQFKGQTNLFTGDYDHVGYEKI